MPRSSSSTTCMAWRVKQPWQIKNFILLSILSPVTPKVMRVPQKCHSSAPCISNELRWISCDVGYFSILAVHPAYRAALSVTSKINGIWSELAENITAHHWRSISETCLMSDICVGHTGLMSSRNKNNLPIFKSPVGSFAHFYNIYEHTTYKKISKCRSSKKTNCVDQGM